MIYDAFTFFNELDLLEIRLNLLQSRVDKFVLVEATTTFSGKPKPLYFGQNKKRYAQFNSKIIHIIVDDLPRNNKDRWSTEDAQRLTFLRGLTNAKDSDIIIMSDLDEIWNPEALPKRVTTPIGFQQKAKGFYLNAKLDRIECNSVAMKYKEFKREYPNLVHRHLLRRRCKQFIQIDNGGWHWTYLGGSEAIRQKLESFSHAEFDNEKGKLLWIGFAQQKKKDCHIPPQSDPDWPKWLKDNWRKYAHLVIDK